MYPVARMTPEANALMIENSLESGLRVGMDCESSGRHTPIMRVTEITAIAMRLRPWICRDTHV